MGVITKDNLRAVLKATAKLQAQAVYVGIPGKTAARENDAPENPDNNAEIGARMEFGSPAANIPARPFLVPGVKAANRRAVKQLRKCADAALAGHHHEVERHLNEAGLIAAAEVKETITEGIPPELAKATIAARRARGRTGMTPLLDTGQLRNSVTYVIREDKP
jgi:phage gpG-like protein